MTVKGRDKRRENKTALIRGLSLLLSYIPNDVRGQRVGKHLKISSPFDQVSSVCFLPLL